MSSAIWNAPFLGCLGDGDEQVGQIALQIAAVRHALLGVDVEADFQLAHGDLDPAHERLEHGQSALGLVPGASHSIQFEKQLAERGDQQGRERLVLVCLNEHGTIVRGRGEPLDLVEQHCLADAPQPGEEDAFFRAPLLHPAQEDPSLLEDSLAADQLGRRGAGAGGERILDGVHEGPGGESSSDV